MISCFILVIPTDMNKRDRLAGNSYWSNTWRDCTSYAPWAFTQKKIQTHKRFRLE